MLSAAALFIGTAPALAGEREGAFSISPFAGGYSFDGEQHLETAPVFGLRLGYDLTKNWGVELVGDYLATEGTRSGTSINALSYRLDILYNLFPDGPMVPYLAVGGGGITFDHGSDAFEIRERSTDGTANAGLGVKYFLPDSVVARYFQTDAVALRGDVRQLFLFEENDSLKYNWEYTAGLTFLFGGKKAAAPVQPAPVPAQPAPAPPAPTSNLTVSPDTITRGQSAILNWSSKDANACNIQPGIGAVQTSGSMSVTPSESGSYTLSCTGQGGATTSSIASLSVTLPAPPPVLDADKDGVPDNLDKCPNTPAGVKVDADGCPIDSDKDGVADYLDKCPDTPAGVKVDAAGCPLDSDKDGVLDYLDRCPDTPAGDKVDANGCTIPVVQPCQSIKLDIEFDTNKADIKQAYHGELKRVADMLKKYPQATTEIEGHTDNVGSDKANLKLSERRASSVREYIINNFGINAERISAKGYGETKPIASNKTVEGRKDNRRVEAILNCGGN